jgi:hypothetical protein
MLRRLTTAGAFTVIALVPFGVWSVISAAVDESVNRRGAAVHAGSARHLRIAVAAFAEWLLPARAGPIVTAASALAVTAVIGLVGWRAVTSVVRHGPPSPLVLPVVVAAANVGLVLVTVFFVAEGNFLDRRSLLPAYAALLPAGVAVVADVASNGHIPRAVVRGGTIGLLVAAFALQVPHVVSQDVEDLGWASASWRDDPAIEVVRSLPPGSVVYSNVPSLLWFTTGVEARRFPGTDVRGGDDGRASAAELDELVRSLRECGGAAVAFDRDVVGASYDADNNAAILAAVGGATDDYDNATVAVVPDDTTARCTVVTGAQ